MKNTAFDPSKYPVEIYYSKEDAGFIAVAKDLPGCSAFGKNQATAVGELQHAIKAWIAAARAAGNPVPNPTEPLPDEALPSGKLLLRIPRSLHASLIECAKRESVSLNQHLVSVLSMSVVVSLVESASRTVANIAGHGGLSVNMANIAFTIDVSKSTTITQGTTGMLYEQWPFFGETETAVIRPRERLDVRTLTAGQPVLVENP